MRGNDGWYESEESTRKVMLQEIRRIKRRTRWSAVIALATVMTAAITYKLVTRKAHYEAEVVLALHEGALATKHTGIPVNELKDFVSSVLMPDAKLADLIQRRNLERLRFTLGMPWAIAELRERIHIEVWRNSFIYYDPERPHGQASARISISITDEDPDDAFMLARDLAAIVTESARDHRLDYAGRIAGEVARMRDSLSQRLSALELERSEKLIAVAKAKRDGKQGVAQAYNLRLTQIDHQQRDTEKLLHEISTSQDALADQIAQAGLDLVLEVVDERRPDRPEDRGLWIAIAAVIVGIGSLCVSALFLGAFDSRVHDADDIARLGLPVLGHVPGFSGDHIGSLEARGVQRHRPPRWAP